MSQTGTSRSERTIRATRVARSWSGSAGPGTSPRVSSTAEAKEVSRRCLCETPRIVLLSSTMAGVW